MLKPKVTLLTTVTNNTAADLCGVPANGSRVVFCSPSWVLIPGVVTALSQGQLQARDIQGNLLSNPLAAGAAMDLMTEVQNYQGMRGFPDFPSYAMTVELHWNLSAVNALMDTIGADILTTDLAALGTTKEAVLGILAPAIPLVTLGMFLEAAAFLGTLTPSVFLTTGRLELYSKMLQAANAIQ